MSRADNIEANLDILKKDIEELQRDFQDIDTRNHRKFKKRIREIITRMKKNGVM